MRLNGPRISPLDPSALDDEQKEVLEPFFARGGVLNIFLTMARAPKALAGFLKWGNYILSGRNSLSPRDRELIILRTGYNCRSGYEWTQHTRIGRDAGLSEEEIARIKQGPESIEWDDRDRAMMRAVDDLTSDHFIRTPNWVALDFFSERQKMDLVFTVGQYTQVSMLLNSFGVQLEEGGALDPDTVDYEARA